MGRNNAAIAWVGPVELEHLSAPVRHRSSRLFDQQRSRRDIPFVLRFAGGNRMDPAAGGKREGPGNGPHGTAGCMGLQRLESSDVVLPWTKGNHWVPAGWLLLPQSRFIIQEDSSASPRGE